MSDALSDLRARVRGRVLMDEAARASHRRDAWVLSELADLEGRPGPLPLAVVEPCDTEDVSQALSWCRTARVPVVAYGGGSGVCGAIRVPEGALVLSMRALTWLVDLDDASLTATFRAGTLGIDAERALERAGLTIGHWPQSIELSTVGGWVATRASGQLSTGYGSIEDVVLALEVVLPDGSVLRTRRTPRSSAGPDLRQLFLGSEGTLGIVTAVTFSLRPLPEARRERSVHFARFEAGLEAVRQILRSGYRPPVARLYDATESRRSFRHACPEGRALLLLIHEGPEAVVDSEADAVSALCREAGGQEAGSAAVLDWLEHRNRVPGFRGYLERGIILDTIEVAATWDRVGRLYARVVEDLRALPEVVAASAHSSHSYRSGTSLYVTFAARPAQRERMPELYRECWRRTMDATLAEGGGIAHHHGIGRVRRDVLPAELGEAGVRVLRGLKGALDPDGLLNPGVLLPDGCAGAEPGGR